MSMTIPHCPLQAGKKIYFASDFHFGIPDHASSREREDRVCAWLHQIKQDAQQIYLMGDLFDVWMEYKTVVPKGTVRFLGKLAELHDAGIDIIIFTGNHDLWMHGYFEAEIGAKVYTHPQTWQLGEKLFHLAHGDGVCKQEKKYRLLKSLLHNRASQWIYRLLHPDLGIRMADYFSRLGPKHKYKELAHKPDDQEYQLIYACEVLQTQAIDYFVFGHRHIPLQKKLTDQCTFINLGDWISYDTYAVFDGIKTSLEKY